MEYKFDEYKRILIEEQHYDDFVEQFEATITLSKLLSHSVKFEYNPGGLDITFSGDVGINLLMADRAPVGYLIGYKIYPKNCQLSIAEDCIMETDKHSFLLQDSKSITSNQDIKDMFHELRGLL